MTSQSALVSLTTLPHCHISWPSLLRNSLCPCNTCSVKVMASCGWLCNLAVTKHLCRYHKSPHFPVSWPQSLEPLYRSWPGEQGVSACRHPNSVFTPASVQRAPSVVPWLCPPMLSGKPSPALPPLTTWVLLQLNETEEPCMVRMDLTWGTLPATI